MANNFNSFPEIPDMEAKDKDENQCKDSEISSEDIAKIIKRMEKQKKTQKKMKRKIRKIEKKISSYDMLNESEKTVVRESKMDSHKNNTLRKEKTFWAKMGDAILKVVPSLITTAATVIATILLGQSPESPSKFRKKVA